MVIVAADVVGGFLVLKVEKRSAREARSKSGGGPNFGLEQDEFLKTESPFTEHDIGS